MITSNHIQNIELYPTELHFIKQHQIRFWQIERQHQILSQIIQYNRAPNKNKSEEAERNVRTSIAIRCTLSASQALAR